MSLITTIFVVFVAIEAFVIMLMEIFSSPKALAKNFSLRDEFAAQEEAQVLLANQGIYNGFVSVMILFSFYSLSGVNSYHGTLLSVGFVVVAAIFGAISSKNLKILLLQGTPAIIALLLLIFVK